MVEDPRTALGNQIVGLGLKGGGYMNDNQFMGLRLRFDGGGCTNSAM